MPALVERLNRLKTERNILQKDIALNTGLSLRSYQYYEKGERIPDANTLAKLCLYFNVSADYLLGLSDEPRPLVQDNPDRT